MTAAVLAEPASSTAPHGERSAGCLCHHLQDGRTHSRTRRGQSRQKPVILTAWNKATPMKTSAVASRRARLPPRVNNLSDSVQCRRLRLASPVGSLQPLRGNITASVNNRPPRCCHMPPKTSRSLGGKVAKHLRVHKDTHTQTSARKRSDDKSRVSAAATKQRCD